MSGTNNGMKKRWISLYVENQVGVLAKVSGLFSGKSDWRQTLPYLGFRHASLGQKGA